MNAVAPPSRWTVALLAVACGAAVANLYYVQPLLDTLRDTFGVGEGTAGVAVTLTQVGYAAGLVLLAPLADRTENRGLVVRILLATAAALAVAGIAWSFAVFLAASIAIGVTSVVAQVLVPFAAHLSPSAARGRIVGQVMGGLATGILLSRTVAGLVAHAFGWRVVYFGSAVVMLGLAAVLGRALPTREPQSQPGYGELLAGLLAVARREAALRRRALLQAAMFGAFSVFWTSIAFVLAGPPFGLSEGGIGLFALVGAAGALTAPAAGRMADRGWGDTVTAVATLGAIGAFVAAAVGREHLAGLAVAAVVLDSAVTATLITGQHVIFGLSAVERSRINTVYIGTFFLGGAAGSLMSAALFPAAGWTAVCIAGACLPAAAVVVGIIGRGCDRFARGLSG